MSVIGNTGSANASVAVIAKEAGVSVGYLYRHYAGKDELINDILDKTFDLMSDKIESLILENKETSDLIGGFIRFLFDTAQKNPDKMRFVLTLQNDFSYKISEHILTRLRSLCEDLLQRGQTANAINPRITAEDIYVIMLSTPLQYIGARIRSIFGKDSPDEKTIRKITAICLSAIK